MRLLLVQASDGASRSQQAQDLVAAGAEGSVSSLLVNVEAIFNSYTLIFLIAFFVTLLFTPIARRMALAAGVVDHPDRARKVHRQPTPYLGGLAVFLGLMAGIALSYAHMDSAAAELGSVPMAIVIGMIAITFTGLADDVWGWDPRLKIAGQLVAAAALAYNDIGVRVAEGVLVPMFGSRGEPLFTLGDLQVLNSHLYYWAGTAIIAFFVLGGCNAANLIDGLDGLLAGVIGIVAIGLLAISVMMALNLPEDVAGESTFSGARLVLSFALLGAVLGFLPHNFNPATIFLGDAGSLLLGFMSVTIILLLGEFGQTHLVFAGLIVFSIPIMDTALAIVRRKLSGRPMSSADDQHIHHQLRRALGGVKRAVFALYGVGLAFAMLGVTLAACTMFTSLRLRVVYVVVLVLFSFIGVLAIKAARRVRLQTAASSAALSAATSSPSKPRSIDIPTPGASGAPGVPGTPGGGAAAAPASRAAKPAAKSSAKPAANPSATSM